MGSFVCADAVTGLTLERGEDAVCLVIARRRGGYPDADLAAAMRTIGATDMFEPVSLPIRGRVGDYGDFLPKGRQVAVDVACAMTGLDGWEEFQAKALDYLGEGVPVGRGFLGGAPEVMVLGVSYLSASTWRHLAKPYGSQDRKADVDAVRDAIASVAGGDAHASGPLGRNFPMASLQSCAHERSDGTRVHLPRLARCLAGDEAGSTFHDAFRAWFPWCSGMVGRLGDGVAVPERAVLEQLWDVQQAMLRMRHLGLLLRPSPAPGGGCNAALVGDLAVEVFERSVSTLLDRAADEMSGDPLDHAASLMARLDAMREALAPRLEAALTMVAADGPRPG